MNETLQYNRDRREVIVSEKRIPKCLEQTLSFLTEVSVRSEVLGDKGYRDIEEISGRAYRGLKKRAMSGVKQMLREGHFRKLGDVDRINMDFFYGIRINNLTQGFYMAKNGLVYPTLKAFATAKGYYSEEAREQYLRVKQEKVRKRQISNSNEEAIRELETELSVEEIKRIFGRKAEVPNLEDPDFFDETMDRDVEIAEMACREAGTWVCGVRGEHSQVKYLEATGEITKD